jgi:hypothetical protein
MILPHIFSKGSIVTSLVIGITKRIIVFCFKAIIGNMVLFFFFFFSEAPMLFLNTKQEAQVRKAFLSFQIHIRTPTKITPFLYFLLKKEIMLEIYLFARSIGL